jgi:uncharacterized protein (DUF849 family)
VDVQTSSDKVILTAAVTGAIHTPTMSTFLPVTPDQIAGDAVKAAEAGAAIVHIHVRDPENGRPTSDLELYRTVLTSIKKRSDVIINTTTGGGMGMTPEERLAVVPTFKPELASFNMGSMNFGTYPLLQKYKAWKYEWEKKAIEATKDYIFRNTFASMETFCRTMRESETKPELECYDVGHVYNLGKLISDGLLKTPVHIQFVLGILGGIGASVEDLVMMKQTADRVIGGGNYTWSAAGPGRFQFGCCITAARMGGHARVGLEDNLYMRKGVLAKSSGEQVARMRELISEVTGRECATPDEARSMLGLKGIEKVAY